MSKISTEHLARHAYVYVRQSTLDQVHHNLESRRRQYGLAERARALGWSEVIVIDDDLGRSGGGVHRPGFERLLAALQHPYDETLAFAAYAEPAPPAVTAAYRTFCGT
jgi:DNA invertase Pin-like site-specific DNA recombinase